MRPLLNCIGCGVAHDTLAGFIATMDDRCTGCIWNVATANIVCKIAIHNSSPAMAFCGKALCFGNAKDSTPSVFSLELADTLYLVRGKSSLLTDADDQITLRKEKKELQKWKMKFAGKP
jgi:hypothetical protein